MDEYTRQMLRSDHLGIRFVMRSQGYDPYNTLDDMISYLPDGHGWVRVYA